MIDNGFFKIMNQYYYFILIFLFSNLFSQYQPQTREELQTAVDMWVDDNETALSTYGEINSWDISLITYMYFLFSENTNPINNTMKLSIVFNL